MALCELLVSSEWTTQQRQAVACFLHHLSAPEQQQALSWSERLSHWQRLAASQVFCSRSEARWSSLN